MEITNVRVRLAEGGNERLCGYCTITIDDEVVVRDLRIIAGEKGLFVAMPSRKNMQRCNRCSQKNPFKAKFCNECGTKLKSSLQPPGQSRLHIDIAHPITSECRNLIQSSVLEAFEAEKEKGDDARTDTGVDHHYDETDKEYA